MKKQVKAVLCQPCAMRARLLSLAHSHAVRTRSSAYMPNCLIRAV